MMLVGMVASVTLGQEELHPIRDEVVEHIRENAKTWKPREVNENPLSKYTLDELKGMLGDDSNADMGHLWEFKNSIPTLPDNFDSREEWPDCIHPIRDQASCGSCWAFGATEALSDRFCIYSGGAVDIVLSPQDMVSCDKSNSACSGGNIGRAWDYLENTGVVSDACMPYSSGKGQVEACPSGCDTFLASPTKYKCEAGSAAYASGIRNIRSFLMEGPLDVNFKVYEDFYSYDSGIYVQTSNVYHGGHAVKLVGFGHDEETGLDFWTIANSWGPDWGENGFFRMAWGEVEVDDVGYGCVPDLSDHLAVV
eukprot:CAMPEP_0170540092 /NCGR_PEP_ID=MMETSP0211-20121228/115_1 /TAXON_ID=311385 /ORGANISM="Pseudokeronopsis sp., Strain OXSARD2" /LENGTH=308 /DNA_ID=CAMNT_0010842371 /DNA_START=21 /DNA_END=950 /DNA_ORIENTATION=-